MEMVVGGLKRALWPVSVPCMKEVAGIGERSRMRLYVLYIPMFGGGGSIRQEGEAEGGRGEEEVLVLWGCPSTSTVASKEKNSTERKKGLSLFPRQGLAAQPGTIRARLRSDSENVLLARSVISVNGTFTESEMRSWLN